MPTTWNRAPEEFHKIYVANTDAFYRLGNNASLAKELDAFVTKCALSLWSRSGGLTDISLQAGHIGGNVLGAVLLHHSYFQFPHAIGIG